jgi:hypothetical protein
MSENRDEDDVVDAEDDLEQGQRRKRNQSFGGEKGIEHIRCLMCLECLGFIFHLRSEAPDTIRPVAGDL